MDKKWWLEWNDESLSWTDGVSCLLILRDRMCQIEGYWKYYNHLVRPHDLPNTADYHLFKEGIKPMWEVRMPGVFSERVCVVFIS